MNNNATHSPHFHNMGDVGRKDADGALLVLWDSQRDKSWKSMPLLAPGPGGCSLVFGEEWRVEGGREALRSFL